MSGGEVLWRIRSKARDAFDYCAWPIRRRREAPRCGQFPLQPRGFSPRGASAPAKACGWGDIGAHLSSGDTPCAEFLSAHESATLRDRADALLSHHMTFFDLQGRFLGDQIDWNYEYKANKQAPMGFSPRIDYRDYSVTGDCKIVWEPNRHHHWVVLARAYRLTGDVRYAQEVVTQLESWLLNCPYGTGMNWRSPLELGIRLINWVWALELIRPAGLIKGAVVGRLLTCVDRQLWEISRKYSRYSAANNHLVGEAAGVFIAAGYFQDLRRASGWRSESRTILLREIVRQTFADGGSREQAFGYHRFVMELFLLAGLAARNASDDFPAPYWDRLEKMFDFAAAMTEGGEAPSYGDCDDGYVLDLDDRPRDVRGLLAVGAVLFDRTDFKTCVNQCSQRVYWLLGPEGRVRFDRIDRDAEEECLISRAFPQSGCYLLQRGRRDSKDSVSVLFDCGGLGFGSIAAHGHADALHFTLRACGVEVIVDPGTYDYFTYNGWRDYFRGTSAHSTIVVDGQDQSEMTGSFMWGRHARARCLRWEPTVEGGVVAGEHDGYGRLADPVIHGRTISLGPGEGEVAIRDELTAAARHDAALYLHLAPWCQAQVIGRNRVGVHCGAGRITITMDPSLDVELVRGRVEPILGWTSRGYHQKSASITIVGRCRFDGNKTLITRLGLESSASEGEHGMNSEGRVATRSVDCDEVAAGRK